MSGRLRLDGVDLDPSSLTDKGRAHLTMIRFADQRIAELKNMQALLIRARRSYIDGIEREIVNARTGIDLKTLISD
jgi:hypothetical protein